MKRLRLLEAICMIEQCDPAGPVNVLVYYFCGIVYCFDGVKFFISIISGD